MSTIEWTDETWNPVTGCTKVSAGCKHCYAERLAPRVFGGQTVDLVPATVGSAGITRPRRFTDVRCHPERLDQPLRWRKPRRVFVNSMSDLFHEDVPDEFIAQVWVVMEASPRHTFQVLTKRPERMRAWLTEFAPVRIVERSGNVIGWERSARHDWEQWPLQNVWLGVSVEDQATADERIPILLDTPAALRFVSYEPALGPVDFDGIVLSESVEPFPGTYNALTDEWWPAEGDARREYDGRIKERFGSAIDWLIVGGESGPGARPFDLQWARDTIRQCREAGVPVFVKQLGARPEVRRDTLIGGIDYAVSLRDRKGGDMSEWSEDIRVREFPT